MDDMLVKSKEAPDHIPHLERCFAIVRRYGMKLNPAKCTFGVTGGKFLGYMVTQRGIEANPEKIKAILELPHPEKLRDVQRLTGKVISLTRLISRSAEKNLPFFKVLRKTENFEWNKECKEAFENLKLYLSSSPLLSKPEEGEPLYIYLAITPKVVIFVLVKSRILFSLFL